MEVFLIKKLKSEFMQSADVFNKNKFVYNQVSFEDSIKKGLSEQQKLMLINELFGDNIIFVKTLKRPVLINAKVQVISDGIHWIRLIDALKQLYPTLKFSHDEFFMNIQVQEPLKEKNPKKSKV